MLPLPPQVFLDLDRTLFDTPKFMDALIVHSADLFGRSSQEFEQVMDDFHVYSGENRYYDFFAHMASWDIEASEIKTKIRSLLHNQNFVFSDVADCLTYFRRQRVNLSILSFGEEDFQKFKHTFVEVAGQLPVVVTRQSKEVYLTQVSQPSVIIDDRRIPNLPQGCRGVQLDRTTDIEISQSENYIIINSLASVKKVFTLVPSSV